MTANASVVVDPGPGPGTSGLPSWTGTGTTKVVPAGGDIQAAITGAKAGDTILLADGTWTGVHLTITKKIRLKALNPLGARLQGHAQPTDGTDKGIIITNPEAAGTFIQDLTVSWYGDRSIDVEDTGGVVISGCQIESNGNFGILLWGTVDTLVYGNSFFDPYLAGMVPTLVDDPSSANWESNNNLVLMDYAVVAYGTVRTQVVQNYFHGQFNQVVSFKEGNRDYTVKNNTFEGFAGSGVLCGQSAASYGPYPYSGQPRAMDTGTLHIEGNVFRPVVGLQLGQLAEYRADSAIRLGHLNQTIAHVSGNIIEAAITGLSLEMGISGSIGGPTGTLYADHNIINGDVYDDGTMVSPTPKIRKVGSWRAIMMDSGVLMNVMIANDTYANSACAIQNDGHAGTLIIDRTIFINNRTTLSGSGAVTNSIFSPNSALPGSGNVAANPQLSSTTVPLRKFKAAVQAPSSDLTTRFRPGSSSPANLSDGTYVGAVAP
jgi:parallel beta-helix repeat protein